MKTTQLLYKNEILVEHCELAFDFWNRFRGLMLRSPEKFKRGNGILFNKCSSIHMFFMRFPIDVVYMDKHFKVLKIVKNLKIYSCSIGPKDSYYVLELPINTTNEIQVGEYISYELPPLTLR